jgi:TM2 domain-containing membrane protein YozV
VLSKEIVQGKEESIRQLVRELPETTRAAFYRETEKKLKDPDTYATLNYLFIAGLHHFYLGKWARGVINISVFVFGIILAFISSPRYGIAVIIAIAIFELYALFRSQIIVQDYNNRIMEEIYRDISIAE